ncbi:pyrroline-5-carboxylate reductase [Candidatus Micrarchaeota archaeon]|nr:pyrroline-5-carboxylate reductase [Candidatus Micrarchaeota archaeon]
MRIALIGIGRLGKALATALSKKHELILVDKDFEETKKSAEKTGGKAAKGLNEIKNPEMIIIAVKPAHVQEVIGQIKGPATVVSCAAGIPIRKLEEWGTGTRNIIRIMPNIAAECNEAVIAYATNDEQNEKRFLAAFSSVGVCLKVEEKNLDPITAISGSGPAFLAFFAKAMIAEAVAEGLDEATAQKAVAQTLIGTGQLMLWDWSPQKIIETVASPGGTTEAGLKMLEADKASEAVKKAVKFATEKARELGK